MEQIMEYINKEIHYLLIDLKIILNNFIIIIKLIFKIKLFRELKI